MVQFRVLVIISPLSSNFNILPAPWCIARCTPYFDTQLHGILPWADINRNYNIFFVSQSAYKMKNEIKINKIKV